MSMQEIMKFSCKILGLYASFFLHASVSFLHDNVTKLTWAVAYILTCMNEDLDDNEISKMHNYIQWDQGVL